ncbi:MAG TPA: hypothetical protein PKC21_05110 [Oligoflexia bacterium]|nr:hypothetical protein [Oligoflexia bacterium]HMR24715.1 hypothetical protein [Oligoflexia bacterium]
MMKNNSKILFLSFSLLVLLFNASCNTQAPKKEIKLSPVQSYKTFTQSTGVTQANSEDTSLIKDQAQEQPVCVFTNPDLNLCATMELPSTVYLGQVYPVSLQFKSLDRGDEVTLDNAINAKVAIAGVEQTFLFSKPEDASKTYASRFIFDQTGDAKITIFISDDEAIELAGEVNINVSKDSEGYKTVEQGLPDNIKFSQEGIELSINWPEAIKTNSLLSEQVYKIDLEANDQFSEEYKIVWLAFMPEMEHKILDFYIKRAEDNVSQMQATLQMIMPGHWVYGVFLYKNDQCIDSKLFTYQVKEDA